MKHPLKAFTLVETLVAVTVLSFAITGPFYVAQSVLTSSYIARDQLLAGALAQEGMEYVRSVRDSNLVYNVHNTGSTREWLYGFDGSTSGGVTSPNCYSAGNFNGVGNLCTVDLTLQTAAQCPSNACTPLNLDNSNLYTQQSGFPATKFTRTVDFKQLTSSSTQVTVTVSWSSHGTFSVKLTEVLTNWL